MPLSCWIALLQKKLVIVPLTFFCVFVFLRFNLTDGCLREAGILPPASLANCRWAYKAVQPESREAAVPELSVGLEAHRLVCLTHSLFVFSFTLSAVHQYLLAPVTVSTAGAQWCVLSVHLIAQLRAALYQGIESDRLLSMCEVE